MRRTWKANPTQPHERHCQGSHFRTTQKGVLDWTLTHTDTCHGPDWPTTNGPQSPWPLGLIEELAVRKTVTDARVKTLKFETSDKVSPLIFATSSFQFNRLILRDHPHPPRRSIVFPSGVRTSFRPQKKASEQQRFAFGPNSGRAATAMEPRWHVWPSPASVETLYL